MDRGGPPVLAGGQPGGPDRAAAGTGPGHAAVAAARAGIDLAFIDAHKPEYVGYWEEIVPRTRPGGLILADNTLWDGEVVRPESETARLVAASTTTWPPTTGLRRSFCRLATGSRWRGGSNLAKLPAG